MIISNEHVGKSTNMVFQCEVVDHMGGKLRVINAARASFNKVHEEFDEKTDSRLMNFLAREEHTMPWRHLQITLHFRVPEFCARQMFRHVVGIESSTPYKDTAWSELSGRYVPYNDVYVPSAFHHQHESKKQGASDIVHNKSDEFYYRSIELTDKIMMLYNEMIAAGVAKEEARIILPMGLYTEFYWTASILALAHFIKLRSKPDAQSHIRDIAEVLKEFAEEVFGDAFTILYKEMESD